MIELKNNIKIAIDGYSSCGKSTFAKQIAEMLGYVYIDTGAMYRALTLHLINNKAINNGDVNEEKIPILINNVKIEFRYNPINSKAETILNDVNVETEIRENYVAEYVSYVAKIKLVRQKLVDIQRELGKNGKIVMDGRDIGSVVFPEAEIKIFMTADTNVRAQRRYKEANEKGEIVSLEEIKSNILKRDNIDENRKESPLIKAKDAIILDNSFLNLNEQKKWFVNVLKQKDLLK
jgi:cytidylate kinase